MPYVAGGFGLIEELRIPSSPRKNDPVKSRAEIRHNSFAEQRLTLPRQ
jgi:hypothetical protein